MEINIIGLVGLLIIIFGYGVITAFIIFIFGMKRNVVNELENIKKLLSDFLYHYHKYEGKK